MNKKIIAALAMGILSLGVVSCSSDNSPINKGGDVYEGSSLKGTISQNTTLDAKVAYQLNGTVFVKEGATLTIPAGTVITASEGFDRYIIVERGGKIDVQGTASNPVIMTGEVQKSGSWGGLIINGKAPLTSSQKEADTEVNTNLKYGGTDQNDNSGSITYLAIKYAGKNNNDNIEHNGLTLNGVGSGTKIENIFIYKSADDGIEFFGGTVSVKNYLSVDSDDDMFDCTQGWRGALTNAYGIWSADHVSTEKDPRGLEADGNHDGTFPTDANQSDFTLTNVTVDLQMAPSSEKGYFMDDVFKVRRGATATINNALIMGTGTAKNLIDTTDGAGNGTIKSMTYNNKLVNSPAELIKGTANAKEDPKATGCDKNLFAWTGYQFAETAAPKLYSGSVLKGDIKENIALDAKVTYTLDGTVYVKEGATLTIPAGTKIVASEGFDRYILVERGGKINVNGTAFNPVIMTGKVEKSGSWGGLIINGKAPLTSSQKEADTEINPNYKYGGNVADDNSGSITYLAIKYAGKNNNDNIEHNGLTLNGVGSGTKIENIFIYKSADDGIEFFGGTVSVKNFLSVDSDDDMFDCTQGWHGTLTNAYGIWSADHVSGEKDPRGLEADGNHDGTFPTDTNQSTFTLENVTIDLQMAPSDLKGYFMDDVFKVRRGATATIKNALVMGQGSAKNFIDTKDGSGNGVVTIDYTNKLTQAPFDAFQVEGGKITATENKDNKGCEKSNFDWTGFFK